MSARLIDGRALAATHEAALRERVAALSHTPHLTLIRVGNDPASELYTSLKQKTAARIGIATTLVALAETTSHADVETAIDVANTNSDTHGILLQLPLPSHLIEHTDALIARISPTKDADGFHPANRATIAERAHSCAPPAPVLPQAVRALLQSTQEHLTGKTMALLVKSENILGKGLQEWLAPLGIETLYTGTDYMHPTVAAADIVVCALGRAHLIQPKHICPGAILIDIGTNVLPDGTTTGDISPDCDAIASWRSPVPGGIGPLTVMTLLENVVALATKKSAS